MANFLFTVSKNDNGSLTVSDHDGNVRYELCGDIDGYWVAAECGYTDGASQKFQDHFQAVAWVMRRFAADMAVELAQ